MRWKRAGNLAPEQDIFAPELFPGESALWTIYSRERLFLGPEPVEAFIGIDLWLDEDVLGLVLDHPVAAKRGVMVYDKSPITKARLRYPLSIWLVNSRYRGDDPSDRRGWFVTAGEPIALIAEMPLFRQ